MARYHALQVVKRAVDVRVEVNGVPLAIHPGPADAQSTQQINPWVAAGENRVRIRIDWPEGVDFSPGLASVSVRIDALEPDQQIGSVPALTRFDWPAGSVEGYPVERSLTFVPREPPPSAFWPRAVPVSFTVQDREANIRLIQEIQQALDGSDLRKLEALLDFKAADVGRSQYLPEGEARRSHSEFLSFLLSVQDFRMRELETENVEMHVLADNRLVWITRPGLEPVLQSEGSPQLQLNVYTAQVDGEWTVVR